MSLDENPGPKRHPRATHPPKSNAVARTTVMERGLMETSFGESSSLRDHEQSGRPDRELASDLEVGEAVRKGTTDPGFERRMIVGDEAAVGQPGLVQPVDRAV